MKLLARRDLGIDDTHFQGSLGNAWPGEISPVAASVRQTSSIVLI